jgi:hypothetical protein
MNRTEIKVGDEVFVYPQTGGRFRGWVVDGPVHDDVFVTVEPEDGTRFERRHWPRTQVSLRPDQPPRQTTVEVPIELLEAIRYHFTESSNMQAIPIEAVKPLVKLLPDPDIELKRKVEALIDPIMDGYFAPALDNVVAEIIETVRKHDG